MIEFSNVTKTYEAGNKAIRKHEHPALPDGEFVFIVGQERVGEIHPAEDAAERGGAYFRTVFLWADMNLQRMPMRAVPRYRRGLGVVFQDFKLLKDRTVYENVAFAQRVIGVSPRKIRENVPRHAAAGGSFVQVQIFILSSCPAESSSGWPSPGR